MEKYNSFLYVIRRNIKGNLYFSEIYFYSVGNAILSWRTCDVTTEAIMPNSKAA